MACRTKHVKRELIRIVYTTEGSIEVDVTGKRNGRGAYLCGSRSCWILALKTGALNRALRVSLTQDDFTVIREYANTLPDKNLQK